MTAKHLNRSDTMNDEAPEGQVFVCGACGKRSKDRYGFKAISHGWDESCMLNAVLCWENSLEFNEDNTMVLKAKAVR